MALAIITSITATASLARSDCNLSSTLNSDSYLNVTVIGSAAACTTAKNISRTVYHHTSYFQSTHIMVIRLVGTLTLLAFRPALTAMMWKALQSLTDGVPSLRVETFQHAIELSNHPDLVPAALYVRTSRTLPLNVVFVVLVGVLSLLSPLAVSPVYKSHLGPYAVNSTLSVGGGVSPTFSADPDYDAAASIRTGVSTGRTLLAAGVLLNIPVFPNTFDISMAPFISLDAVTEIWEANISTVVARNTVDCSATALKRLNVTGPVVALDENIYFDSDVTESNPSFLGTTLGGILNDPEMAVVYLNGTIGVQPGALTAEVTVVFLGANGTIEGAQQTITSPNPESRIRSVDVLVCTSTTTLELSHCTISRGNVTSCTAHVPAYALTDTTGTGGLDAYIINPNSTAMILATSPVSAFYNLPDNLPMYRISNSVVAAEQPPMSDTTEDIVENVYHVSLSYITNVAFGQAAQALVQGLVQSKSREIYQSLELTATFATSKMLLDCLILGICAGCAIVATFSGMWSFRTRYAPLDVVRLLAVSRNDQLDHAFASYADLNVPVDEEVLQRKIGYGWVEKVGSQVLMTDPRSDSRTEDVVEEKLHKEDIYSGND